MIFIVRLIWKVKGLNSDGILFRNRQEKMTRVRTLTRCLFLSFSRFLGFCTLYMFLILGLGRFRLTSKMRRTSLYYCILDNTANLLVNIVRELTCIQELSVYGVLGYTATYVA